MKGTRSQMTSHSELRKRQQTNNLFIDKPETPELQNIEWIKEAGDTEIWDVYSEV